jgi:hypothetical protein
MPTRRERKRKSFLHPHRTLKTDFADSISEERDMATEGPCQQADEMAQPLNVLNEFKWCFKPFSKCFMRMKSNSKQGVKTVVLIL